MADAFAENDVVEIDETVLLNEAEQKAIQDFILEVNKETATADGHDVDDETALRFLRARKFDVERAVALFAAHKNACVQFDLNDLTPLEEPLWSELLSGKFTVLPGKDLAGASVCLFTERLHFPNKTTHKAVLKSIFLQLNEVTKSDITQLNGMVLIYDMKWASYKNFDYDLCMKTLSLLKGAFPARLKHVYILSAPLWFRATLAILSSFLREKIRNRVEVLKTSQDLLARVPASTLPIHLGGNHLIDHDAWLERCIANHNRSSHKNDLEIPKINSSTNTSHSRNFTTEVADEFNEKNSDSDVEIESDSSQNVYEFIDHINKVGKNGIYEEYRQIKSQPPLGMFHESRHPFNLAKNRYKDVLCYDHSGVRLPVINEDDFSGYINASYVDGFMDGAKQEKAYICTQGPLENTAFDFWRMILENHVKIIVMITRCVERGREKCFKYWPNKGDIIDYEFLTVRNLGETLCQDYIIRNLQLHHKKEGEEIVENVTQLQFTSWPDFGVLSSAEKFLSILNEVRKFQSIIPKGSENDIRNNYHEKSTNAPSPIVVHCSAGIGRTGTFLAIDINLRGIDSCDRVNVPHVVREIRKQRAFCIQTAEQYAFCYTAILQYIFHRMMESGSESHIEMVEDCLREWLGKHEDEN